MQWESGHKTYILRVWPVERDAQPALVAVLEDCQTNERQAFASLSELLEFLEGSGQALPQAAHHSFESEEALTPAPYALHARAATTVAVTATYATTAGDADTVDGYHAGQLFYWTLTGNAGTDPAANFARPMMSLSPCG